MNNEELMSVQELREAVATLHADVLAMCNSKTIDENCEKFVEAKELLIKIYKNNVGRLTN